jgi:hypothetical protein
LKPESNHQAIALTRLLGFKLVRVGVQNLFNFHPKLIEIGVKTVFELLKTGKIDFVQQILPPLLQTYKTNQDLKFVNVFYLWKQKKETAILFFKDSIPEKFTETDLKSVQKLIIEICQSSSPNEKIIWLQTLIDKMLANIENTILSQKINDLITKLSLMLLENYIILKDIKKSTTLIDNLSEKCSNSPEFFNQKFLFLKLTNQTKDEFIKTFKESIFCFVNIYRNSNEFDWVVKFIHKIVDAGYGDLGLEILENVSEKRPVGGFDRVDQLFREQMLMIKIYLIIQSDAGKGKVDSTINTNPVVKDNVNSNLNTNPVVKADSISKADDSMLIETDTVLVEDNSLNITTSPNTSFLHISKSISMARPNTSYHPKSTDRTEMEDERPKSSGRPSFIDHLSEPKQTSVFQIQNALNNFGEIDRSLEAIKSSLVQIWKFGDLKASNQDYSTGLELYKIASGLFSSNLSDSRNNAILCRKMAYCSIKLKHFDEAFEYCLKGILN